MYIGGKYKIHLYRLLTGDPMASISGSAVEFFFFMTMFFFCVFKFYLPGKTKKYLYFYCTANVMTVTITIKLLKKIG